MVDALDILGVIDLCLVIFGTIFNMFILATCVIRLRRQVTFIFIAFLSVTDTVALYGWCLSHFTDAFVEFDLFISTMFSCKFVPFFQYASQQSSAWLLVLMSLERLISILKPRWRISVFKEKQAVITCVVAVTLIAFINSNVLFLFGYDDTLSNGTTVFYCWATDGIPQTQWTNTWDWVQACLYSYLPFTLLAIINITMIVSLRFQSSKFTTSSSSSAATAKRQKSVTITIIIITVSFILFTGTGAVVNFFYDELVVTDSGYDIIVLGDTLVFTFHAMNIIMLLITNKRFREEFCSLILTKITFGKYRVEPSGSTVQGSTHRAQNFKAISSISANTNPPNPIIVDE